MYKTVYGHKDGHMDRTMLYFVSFFKYVLVLTVIKLHQYLPFGYQIMPCTRFL